MRRSIALPALALAAGLHGCRSSEIAAGVTDSAFVATMAALRQVNEDESRDSASKVAARDSVLQSRGLTPDEVTAAARALAADTDRAIAIWRRIGEQVNRPQRGDTASR
jgi:hypothetical protein